MRPKDELVAHCSVPVLTGSTTLTTASKAAAEISRFTPRRGSSRAFGRRSGTALSSKNSTT